MRIFLIAICFLVVEANAQGSAGSGSKYESRFIVDMPTAGIIPHGNFALDMQNYQTGGLLTGLTFGLFNRITFGISYGGEYIIGSEKPDWNSLPGFNVKLRFLDETMVVPALALGFDSQGKDGYDEELDRYAIKSPGFFIAASKNYSFLGYLSVHGGVNYSLERADDDRDPNLYAGLEKTIGPSAAFMAEYNLGWNDSHNRALGRGRGYLNFALRFSVGDGFSLGFQMKDVLDNQRKVTFGTRSLSIEYIHPL
jgi:hypothetical protein